MLRQYPNQLQLFARHIVASIPRFYGTKKTNQNHQPKTNSKDSKDDEVVVTQELGASFFARNIGKLLTIQT